jgi:apolipoprotein N-acyltransferase
VSRFAAEQADSSGGGRAQARTRIFLSVLSGVMLGFSFPPSPFGVLACFGLVPFLIVLADCERIGASLKYSYLAFLVFHVITLNWTGGYAHGNDVYMMIAGAITMLWHPLFYFIPVLLYMFVKRHLGGVASLIALPFIWVAYECTHSLSEWSFPWLTIGNSQSYELARIQFISATGVYGLSLWILLMNTLAYWLYSVVAQKLWAPVSLKSAGLVILILGVYYLPSVHGAIILAGAPPMGRPLESGTFDSISVGMIQSNIDPWEKWSMRGTEPTELYLRLTRDLVDRHADRKPDIILWPETAVPFYLLTDANRTAREYLHGQIDALGVPVLTGLPHAVMYEDSTKAPPSSKRLSTTGQRYDAFNAAAILQPGTREISWYGKMKMVPIAERVPYADAFYFLDFLRWGVGIGGWQIGPDSTIFVEQRTGTRFSTMICYESTYPDFVAAFVRKGAEFIAIITIDSWWGRMSGAFQHQQFAIFRAVENRRWIARCAVGGFSCFIDPYGRVYDKTDLFTQTSLVRTLERSSALTIYTAHGDWLSEVCLLVAGMFCAAALGQKFKNKKRGLAWQTNQ